MKRYIRIYGQLVRLNWASLLAYRTNFINSALASVGWGLISFYSVVLLTTRITSAYGWSRNELLLFNAIYGVMIGVFHMFVSINMGRFSRIIHLGDLDGILIKPIDSQFAVSLWLIDFTIILRIAIAAGFAVWVLSILGITLTLAQVLTLVLFSASAWIVLYAIWFLVLTNVIWHTTLSNLVFLLYSFESLGRFPKEMTAQLSHIFFLLVLPIALVVNTPTRAILGKLVIGDAVTLFAFAIGLGMAARGYWRFALRHYASASS